MDAPLHRHIPSLDGLRAVAVSLVILQHGNSLAEGPPTGPLGAGWTGVDLFFAISGFLITGILFRAKGSEGYFRNFYARRALRIFPLYYGYLAFLLVILPLVRPATVRFRPPAGGVASLLFYYYNFYAPLEEGLMLVHHFWSLAVEEHFYLVWPLVVWRCGRRALMGVCIAGAAASFAARVAAVPFDLEAAYMMTPCRLDAILLGSFAALAKCGGDWPGWVGRARYACAASLCCVVGVALGAGHFAVDAPAGSDLVLTAGVGALAVFCASLVVVASESPRAARLLEARPLRFVGRYSYGIYVFHFFVMFCGFRFAHNRAALAALTFAGSLAAAWLSFHLYEKHFLRLKRFFEYRRREANSPTGPPRTN